MIQSYNDIESNISQFKDFFEENLHIQKVYSSSRYVSFGLRAPGKTIYLFIGRGKGYEGIWLGDKQVVSALRKRDQFLEYLRKHLTNTKLIDVSIDTDDRIISFKYIKYAKEHMFSVFYSGRKTYFLNRFYNIKKEKMELFTSWSKLRDVPEESENSLFDEVGRSKLDKSKSNSIKTIKALLEDESKVGLKSIQKKKEKKFLKRKESKIREDLELMNKDQSVLEFIKTHEQLDKLPIRIVIDGIKLKFQTSEHFKRRDELYAKVKKMKKAQNILRLRLEDTVEKLENEQSQNVDYSILDPIHVLMKEQSVERVEIKKQGYSIASIEGIELGFGLNAQGNDQLRKEWASKNDYWFHVSDQQSSHIILKSVAVLTQEIFQVIAKKMIELSSLRSTEVNLVYTQVKNLKGVKGKPGSVLYKKEKYIRVYV